MRPLADVRILAVEQYGAGPFGSVHLADLGADVIKIEDPTSKGDVGRYVPPYQEGEDSLFFEAFNRNKRSVSLDLAHPGGRAVFEDLVRVSDGVYSNLRGDVPEKMRLRYDDLKELNPRVVCCSLTGFGMTGPRRDEPGYDYVLQALAGWMEITGEPEGPPTKSGLSLVDYSGGLVAALSMLAGLHAAARTGVGMDCDVSLFDTAIAMLTYPAIWRLNGDFEPRRLAHSAHPSLVPFQAFATADGWIVVACPKEKFWRRLAAVIDRPELADDARFADFASRRRFAAVLVPLLDEVFATRPSSEWLLRLGEAGVPSGRVNTVGEALADPHTRARGMIVETEHLRFGTIRQVAGPVRVGDSDRRHTRAPWRGEHTADVLRELLGWDEAAIRSLLSSPAVQGPATSAPPRPEAPAHRE